MEEKTQQFRSAAFGGFHKQDVLNYIETSTREHSAKIEAMQRELEEAGKAKTALEGEKAELSTKLESTSTELEEAASALEWANTEMEKKDARLSTLESETAALREKVKALEPDADAYRKVKDRTAGIELEAHCRAQAAEAAAREHVKKAMAELEQWTVKVQSGYDRLRTDVDTTIAHAVGELGRVGDTLNGISASFSAHDAELAALLEDCREARGPQAPMPLNIDGE